ncbi:MAG TPA: hypothetical protein VI461_04175, partial [Chitinophagaceae bacterium]|nr:hypothetical protein [Chitinophagaceae bacterium]
MHFLFLLTTVSLVSGIACWGQQTPNQTLNLSFERTNDKGQIIGCSFPWDKDNYFTYKDDSVKIDGNNSVRLQKEPASSSRGFGTVTFSLPANFKGSEVTLKGYIKTEAVQDGYAGLWLRTDAGNQMVGFDNMGENGVKGTQEWKQYSITVPMDEDVTAIVFGGLLVGKGKTWFDKLELLIDNKPVESVTWIPGKTKSRRQELAASGATIDSNLNNQQIDNLYTLGRLWGFLKYHHPEVAKGNYDFDSSLFSIIPNVLKAGNMNERDDIFFNWINTLGDENSYPAAKPLDEKYLHTKPDLTWLNDKALFSEKLSAKLNNIYQHRNTGSNYYVRLMPGVGNPIFDKEATYKSVPAGDDGFRMLALFRYWNMIEYFFPYKHLLKESWTGVLKDFVPEFAFNRSPLSYRLACLRLINRVHDTHANIYNDMMLNNHFGKNGPAVGFKMSDNKVVVAAYLSDSLAVFESLKPGDEIIEVNGKKIREIRKSVEPYLCASNISAADRNFLERFLFKSNDDSLIVTYKRNNKTGKGILRLYAAGKFPYRNGDSWRMPMYKLLSPDIGYISLGKIEADSLKVIFKKLENTKGIVIDIRNYPKQFMPFDMAQYLKSLPSPFVKFTNGDINNPGSFSITESIENGTSG